MSTVPFTAAEYAPHLLLGIAVLAKLTCFFCTNSATACYIFAGESIPQEAIAAATAAAQSAAAAAQKAAYEPAPYNPLASV